MTYEKRVEIRREPTVGDLFRFLYCVLFCLVIFTGTGPLFQFTSESIAAIAVLQILFAFSIKKVAYFQRGAKLILIYYSFIILGYLLYNYYHSYSRGASMSYLLRFFVYGLILMVALTPEWQKEILSVASNYAVVIAVVYLLSFPFFGADSGILGSYQVTGISMSIALGLYVARFFVNGRIKKTDLFKALLLFMALMLTGKRTLSVIPVLMIGLTFILSCDKKKYQKLLIGFFVALIAVPILVALIPGLLNVYQRIVNGLSDKTLTYRVYFWQYAMMLWHQHPITGIGFGNFPVHIADHSNLVDDYFHTINAYDTHNIYFQMLAEVGTVGLVIFCTFFFICLVYTVRCILKYQRSVGSTYVYLMYVSLYLQCWFLLYGITGNPLYMADECYLYFFAVSNIFSIRYQIANLQLQKNSGAACSIRDKQDGLLYGQIRNVRNSWI